MKWLYLVVGSIIGGSARYGLASAVYQRWGAEFPYGTLVVNLSGCALIGVFNAMSEDRFGLGPHERLFLMTGFCGAYTTFSTLILETSNLFHEGGSGLGWIYFLLSCGGGFALFRLGSIVGKFF